DRRARTGIHPDRGRRRASRDKPAGGALLVRLQRRPAHRRPDRRRGPLLWRDDRAPGHPRQSSRGAPAAERGMRRRRRLDPVDGAVEPSAPRSERRRRAAAARRPLARPDHRGHPRRPAACGSTTSAPPSTGAGGGPGGLPLARPDKRVTLPRWEDPIKSGLEPETGGTFTVFNYPAYLYKKLLNDFGAKYGVQVQYTPFDNINSGLQRLASGAVTPDVMEITPDTLDMGVAGKLIKPLNLDYIPNLKKNIWPELIDPLYDGESRYTAPYTCDATGIASRTD